MAYRAVCGDRDSIGKRGGVDGREDDVITEDGRLVDADSCTGRTGHVLAHAAVADHFVDRTRHIL